MINSNRRRACPRGLAQQNSVPSGNSCDEYPFASTAQGAATPGNGKKRVFKGCKLTEDFNDGPHGFSRCFINNSQNTQSGSNYGVFLGNATGKGNRILRGDPFYVQVVT